MEKARDGQRETARGTDGTFPRARVAVNIPSVTVFPSPCSHRVPSPCSLPPASLAIVVLHAFGAGLTLHFAFELMRFAKGLAEAE